jgi:hypothetical protein
MLLALSCSFGCADGCRPGDRSMPMCGKCMRSSDCRRGLECVNATCETTPPSCHVKIGL